MDGLFSPVDLHDPEAETRSGYRLQRLELLNWGTFDQRVWTFELDGSNALLTGDIGSGKSTVVDAVTTLLLPSHRIAYNKAAGADARERSLKSYVLGYHKSERSETTGASRPVALRGSDSYSVILGVFANEGYDETVTLAQVFWTRDGDTGQPQRFFVVASTDLSVAADFSDFGSDITLLKKRLRAAGYTVRDHFPDYGKDFRRALGIDSEQAMELFHQTVSMKSVGDLNDFVRNHMLEPFDAAQWTDRLVAHFEDLTRAHEAVLKAQSQLNDLTPLLADCDRYDALSAEIDAMTSQRAAVRFFAAQHKSELLGDRVTRLRAALEADEAELARVDRRLQELDDERSRLQLERAGLGGDRLGELERLIADDERVRVARQDKAHRFNALLKEAGLEPVVTAEQFTDRRTRIHDSIATADGEQADTQNRLTETAIALQQLEQEAKEVNAELTSLRGRRSNIPSHFLELRDRLCAAVDVDPTELPFAGELLQVRADAADWEGAAERVLRGFGLSLLVPTSHYRKVSDWINEHHLGTRLVYYRVPAKLVPDTGRGPAPSEPLYSKLEIQDSPFYPWLERELVSRAGHQCVDTMEDFRRTPRAVTRAGQVKSGGRHEKNDSTRVDDRRSYVLGWSNEQKIDALLEQAGAVHAELTARRATLSRLQDALKTASTRQAVLARLDEFRDFAELDWQSLVNRIAGYQAERRRIEESSTELARVAETLERVEGEIGEAQRARDILTGRIATQRKDHEAAERGLRLVADLLAAPERSEAEQHYPLLLERFGETLPDAPEDLDRFETSIQQELTELMEERSRQRTLRANRIVAGMKDFRAAYPVDSVDLDDSVEAIAEYRELHRRLVADDLPRFEAEFKTFLNTNTIRDIATFQSQLNRQREQIKDRIDTINASLVGIDYNPGRYIRLESHLTPNTEIREFRSDLRACTDNALAANDSQQYSEEKFLQVKRLVERFKGREGQTEADRAWTERVTDVRNWFVFSASERLRDDDSEFETYTDSGGKSGGQKEKLAYTILAASLAYQFKLDWGAARSKSFRFVVIDEAFGRGSDESTRFALSLFRRLGLQLLIVTPLQKIRVIEPFVSAVGFVDNTTGSYSRLQTLTITEYQERQRAVARARASIVLDQGS
ncbi:MAG TPA: SbcC/MukB-like Walker B domain-containing protein [Actinomycetales bacterium]|nr:SbcC/MukB-like Walker B domain-containing protein [Actinomycetales bacterium]